jgi:CubicO group peptidase (beta-lactamase class C family)
MQRSFSLIATLCLCATVAGAQNPKEKLARLMDYYAQEENFNGSVLIAKKGTILLEKGYGYANIETKAPNTAATIYELGSNTKQFTGEVIVQLDSKGRLGIEDKVSKYIPGIPNGDRITLKELLTHTSGLYNYTKEDELRITHPDRPVYKEQILDIIKTHPTEFEPGTKFEYSNSNYYLLGCVIEKITGFRYETQVRRHIFEPCGMNHSGFDFTHLRDADKATGYYYINPDKVMEAPITDSSVSYAAGGMFTTVGDMYRWHQSLEHYKLLPKDWQGLSYRANKEHYAMGWQIEKIAGHEFFDHSGSITGFSSYVMRQEGDDIFVVILQNNMKPGTSNETIGKNIAECLYNPGYKLPLDKPLTIVKPETLQSYAGDYDINSDFSVKVTLNGSQLSAQATGQSKVKLRPETQTLFRAEGVEATTIEFVKDKSGAVTEITVHQHGTDVTGTRR